ncbi:MAG: hypothetical protein CUN55_06200 [Phototrophicales bacterium]|nr:MAG: hypothetical protein CUN55_06200 [Phototrophicales bacterium]
MSEKRLQPNSQKCFVCGLSNPLGLKLRFYSVGDDSIETRVTFGEFHQSYPGIVHGGIVATVLDELVGRSMLAKDPDALTYTATFNLKYRHSVPLETEILFRGRILKDRGRIVQVQGEAILPDGTIAVEAEATCVRIPPERLAEFDVDEVGWRVYPDDGQ